jgi:glutathione synthase
LFLEGNVLYVEAREISVLVEDGQTHFENQGNERVPVNEFDVVWMREDPPFDRQYLYSTYLLEHTDTFVINNPSGIRDTNEKLVILEFPDLIPDTWVGTDFDAGWDFVRAHENGAVLKTLSGFGGEEVFIVPDNRSEARDLFLESSDGQSVPLLLQEYLPEVKKEGDRRLILLGGEPIGGLTRYPADGDFRANLHSGGRTGDVYVSEREREIARQLKPALMDRGLHLVGVDLVSDMVTEINVTSPTCVREITRASDRNLQDEITEYACKRIPG